ncbi:MAG: hypothetical protein HQK91_01085 [Nitrospirae bacterium]|nr:hypothetical protein [Nitrospirota bacterium]MBF0540030.1 hypothetical protein [Nitrospirota bacterium]
MNSTDRKSVLAKKEYKNFGLLVGVIFIIIAFIPVIKGRNLNVYTAVIGSILIILALIAPYFLYPVYKIWMKVGHILGKINAFIILSVIYYVILTPGAVFARLIKGSNKKYAFKSDELTTWIKREPGNPSEDIKRMF